MFDGNLTASPTTLPMAATPVTSAANFAKQKLTIGPINIPAPGYVYIYVNNNSDTPNWLHFDDLKVTQTHSPFVAGGDFYPFGLTMEDRQIKAERYRYGYQGQFAEKDSLTNLNQFEHRMFDPKFGRWTSRDPHKQFWSPYVGIGNNPVSGFDKDGQDVILLNAPEGAANFGHGALLVGNDKNGWRYISKEGTALGVYGPPNDLTKAVQKDLGAGRKYNTVQDFLESEYNLDNRYTTGIHFTTTPSQDRAIIRQANQGLSRNYDLFNDNCIQNCTRPLEKQNVISKDYGNGIPSYLPNKNYESLLRNVVKSQGNTGMMTAIPSYKPSGAAFILFHSLTFTPKPRASVIVGGYKFFK